MAQAEAPIRAGLIYQQQALADRLRNTLVEAGISIDAQYNVEALRSADLSGQDIEVYIVNLEPELEDLFDEVADRLDEATVPVVFNDAGVSSDLSGWDQARWARHLASKIRKGRGNLPPVPDDAEAIPTPQRSNDAIEQTVPMETEVAMPESESFEVASSEAAAEVAAPELAELETEAVPAERLAVPTEPAEAVADQASLSDADLGDLELALEEDSESTVTTDTVADPSGAFEFDSIGEEEMEALDLLGDDEGPPPESVGGDREAYAAELAAGMAADSDGDSDNDLLDADWLSDEASAEPIAEDADLDWQNVELEADTDAISMAQSESDDGDTLGAGDEAQMLADLLDSGPETAADEGLEALDLEVDELTVADVTVAEDLNLEADSSLDELEAPFEQSTDEDVEAGVLAELEGFSESELEPSSAPESADFLDGDSDFGALDLDFEVPDEPPAEDGLVDLDAMLAAQPAEQDAAPSSPPAEPSSSEPEPSAAGVDAPEDGLEDLAELPDLDSWALEPVDGEETPTAVEPADRSKTPTKRVETVPEPSSSLADLQLSLDDLGLVPMDDQPDESAVAAAQEEMPNVRFGIDLESLDSRSAQREAEAAAAAEALQDSEPTTVSDPAPITTSDAAAGAGPRRVVVLGASIGGPDSIRNFLSRLNTGLGAAFILVQHMGAEFLDLMAQQLDRVSPLGVHLAKHGQELKEGEVVIAPVGHRLCVDDAGKLDLSSESGPTAYSPSIDQVLGDSLQRWGSDRLLVIIFSGMASDAVEGSKQLAAAGVPIWAQDPASCVISSMVDGVVAAKVVSFVGSPEQLAEQANKLLA